MQEIYIEITFNRQEGCFYFYVDYRNGAGSDRNIFELFNDLKVPDQLREKVLDRIKNLSLKTKPFTITETSK